MYRAALLLIVVGCNHPIGQVPVAKVPAPEVQIPEGSSHVADVWAAIEKETENPARKLPGWKGRVTGRVVKLARGSGDLDAIIEDVRNIEGTGCVCTLAGSPLDVRDINTGDIITVEGRRVQSSGNDSPLDRVYPDCFRVQGMLVAVTPSK